MELLQLVLKDVQILKLITFAVFMADKGIVSAKLTFILNGELIK